MEEQHNSVVVLKEDEGSLISDGCKTFATGDKAQTAINGLLQIKTTEQAEAYFRVLKKGKVKSNKIERYRTLAEASVSKDVEVVETDVDTPYIKVKTKTKHEPAVTF
jgi:hypothetical protein